MVKHLHLLLLLFVYIRCCVMIGALQGCRGRRVSKKMGGRSMYTCGNVWGAWKKVRETVVNPVTKTREQVMNLIYRLAQMLHQLAQNCTLTFISLASGKDVSKFTFTTFATDERRSGPLREVHLSPENL